jgi:hypothetical protein
MQALTPPLAVRADLGIPKPLPELLADIARRGVLETVVSEVADAFAFCPRFGQRRNPDPDNRDRTLCRRSIRVLRARLCTRHHAAHRDFY